MAKWLTRGAILALIPSSLALTIPAENAASPSVVTITSTGLSTVTSTSTSTFPITTTTSTCSVGSVAPAALACTNTVWSKGSTYYSEGCTDVSLSGGTPRQTLVGANIYLCYLYCSIYSSICSGANYNTRNDQCTIVSGSLETVSASGYQALEVFTTNPCVATVTASVSTEYVTNTATVEYTTVYTSTIPTSTPSPTPMSTPSSTPTPAAASTVVSCTTAVPNLVQNPSFEDGFTDWGYASGTSGSVVSGDAADGDSFLESADSQTRAGILFYQYVNDFEAGKTYAASLDWRAYAGSDSGTLSCHLYWYMNSFGSSIGSTSATVASSNMEWTTFSTSFTPTTDGTHLLEIYAYCQQSTTVYTGNRIEIDNIQLSDGVATTSCVTSTVTPTPTPTPSSSVVVSLSSSVLVTPSSKPVTPSSSPVSSSAVRSSSMAVSSPFSSPVRSSSAFYSVPVKSSSTPISVRSSPIPSSSAVPFRSSSLIRSSSSGIHTASVHSSVIPSSLARSSAPHSVPHSVQVSSSGVAPLSSSLSRLPSGTPSSLRTSVPHSRPIASSSRLVPGLSSIPVSSSGIPLTHGGSKPSSSLAHFVKPSGLSASKSTVSSQFSASTGTSPNGLPSGSPVPTGGAGSGPSASSSVKMTTSTILSTRTATITGCPSFVPNCPIETPYVTTETIVISTTVCPVTEVTATSEPSQPSAPTKAAHESGSNEGRFTTSTILSTRTATITACPSSVTDCPARSKTTSLTTETLVVSTTVCPVTEVSQLATPTATVAPNAPSQAGYTTSTIFSTRTATITACPSSVTDCPARSKTTSLTTETLVVSTTICPLTDVTQLAQPTKATGGIDTSETEYTTSTILSTRTATITACPSSVTDCPARSKTAFLTTETLVVSTTVCPLSDVSTITQQAQPTHPTANADAVHETKTENVRFTTSTILSTRVATITVTPSAHAGQPSLPSTLVTTETIVVATTVCPVTETEVPTASSASTQVSSLSTISEGTAAATAVEDVAAIETASIQLENASGSKESSPAQSTSTIIVEACSNGESTCPQSVRLTYTAVATMSPKPTNPALGYHTVNTTSVDRNGTTALGHSAFHISAPSSTSNTVQSSPSSVTSSALNALFTGASASTNPRSAIQLIVSFALLLFSVLF